MCREPMEMVCHKCREVVLNSTPFLKAHAVLKHDGAITAFYPAIKEDRRRKYENEHQNRKV